MTFRSWVVDPLHSQFDFCFNKQKPRKNNITICGFGARKNATEHFLRSEIEQIVILFFRGFVCLFTQKQTAYLVDKSSAFLRSLAIIPFFSGFGTGALRKLLMLVM